MKLKRYNFDELKTSPNEAIIRLVDLTKQSEVMKSGDIYSATSSITSIFYGFRHLFNYTGQKFRAVTINLVSEFVNQRINAYVWNEAGTEILARATALTKLSNANEEMLFVFDRTISAELTSDSRLYIGYQSNNPNERVNRVMYTGNNYDWDAAAQYSADIDDPSTWSNITAPNIPKYRMYNLYDLYLSQEFLEASLYSRLFTAGKNKFNKADYADEHYVSWVDGELKPNSAYFTSGFMGVKNISSTHSSDGCNKYAFYDSAHDFISGANAADAVVSVPATAEFFRRSFLKSVTTPAAVQVESGIEGTTYEPYHEIINLVNRQITLEKMAQQVQDLIGANIRVVLADNVPAVVGDTMQLFFRGMIESKNPYDFNIDVQSNLGKTFARYIEYTPLIGDVGNHPTTIQVKSESGAVLGEISTNIEVVEAVQQPATQINAALVGDSLTNGDIIAAEVSRRLTGSGGTPAGHGFGNIAFLGDVSFNPANLHCIGYSGKQWHWYNNAASAPDNPFWDSANSKVSFTKFCADRGYSGIDVVYTFLSWNGQAADQPYPSSPKNVYNRAEAEIFINNLRSDYPNAEVKLMGMSLPAPYGGLSVYGTNGDGYANYYGLVRTIFGWNLTLQEIANDPAYSSFVEYVPATAQFDNEYGFDMVSKPANTRSAATEEHENNGIHPSSDGRKMIADVIYRNFIKNYCQ